MLRALISPLIITFKKSLFCSLNVPAYYFMNTYQLLSQTYLLVGLKQTKKITITQTCFAAVDTEAVFLTDEALGQAQALGNNFAGI